MPLNHLIISNFQSITWTVDIRKKDIVCDPSLLDLYVCHCIYSIAFRSVATLKGAAVLLRISSTVTPSAYSVRVSPSVVLTSNTARSVIIFETQRGPVRGKVQSRLGQR